MDTPPLNLQELFDGCTWSKDPITVTDYPSGRHRVWAQWIVEEKQSKAGKKSTRVARVTENKHGQKCNPKRTTYYDVSLLTVAGDRTYILQYSSQYGMVCLTDGTLKAERTLYADDCPESFKEALNLVSMFPPPRPNQGENHKARLMFVHANHVDLALERGFAHQS